MFTSRRRVHFRDLTAICGILAATSTGFWLFMVLAGHSAASPVPQPPRKMEKEEWKGSRPKVKRDKERETKPAGCWRENNALGRAHDRTKGEKNLTHTNF